MSTLVETGETTPLFKKPRTISSNVISAEETDLLRMRYFNCAECEGHCQKAAASVWKA